MRNVTSFWTGAVCAALLSMGSVGSALADEYPLVAGDFWDLSAIKIKDGGDLAYATFIANEWRADQEFAKSKGWIKGYHVLSNTWSRHDEADLYLIVVYEKIPTSAESEARSDEYLAWKKKTNAQLSKESGNRVEIRELFGTELLTELKFRK